MIYIILSNTHPQVLETYISLLINFYQTNKNSEIRIYDHLVIKTLISY
jgi:hypothetical protein